MTSDAAGGDSSVPAGAVGWDLASQNPNSGPKVELQHWFFHKMEDLYFQLSAEDEPTVLAKYAKSEVVLTLKGVSKEFNIDANSPDGQMLEYIAKSLKYVKALRVGDPLPSEIFTRKASWALSKRHREIAIQRVSMQLVNWMSGGDSVITDPDELLQLAGDPATKKNINTAFGEAAESIGYGRDHKEMVIKHVEDLADELAYIEALRDRYRRIKNMEHKIQELRRLYGREQSILEIADQVARLGERAVSEFDAMFLEVDAQTGEIISVLRNLDAQVAYIRDVRDNLHIRLMAWDGLLNQWDRVEMKPNRDHPNLLRETYKFLAPRFMMVKQWVLMSKLQEHSKAPPAVSQMGDGQGKKKFGQPMKW